jgi:glycosyltransferase involved in cell wall biosynthesis
MYWNNIHVAYAYRKMKDQSFDLIVANDIQALPLAYKLANGAKLLFDAHEYAPREYEDNLNWVLLYQSFVKHLCKTYIPKVDGMMTVCEGIAREYKREFQIECDVLTNAPHFRNLKPTPVDERKVSMIYHGVATSSRSVEEVIELMSFLDNRFYLDMILIPGCTKYIDKIKKIGSKNNRIRFLDPVPTHEIPSFCNPYTLGLFPLRPKNFNYLHALPNKFFEFIQARIPPVISPLPEMGKIVQKYQCGIVSEDFSPRAFAKTVNQITCEEIIAMKRNTENAAKEFSAERNFEKFQAIINKII